MKRILDAAGMVSAPSPRPPRDLGDADRYAEHLGILRRCIEIADLGTNVIRGLAF